MVEYLYNHCHEFTMINQNKKIAIQMRRSGSSYNEISKKLDIPKSTLSYWFSNDHVSSKIKESNVLKAKEKWAKNIRSYNILRAEAARQLWRERSELASHDIGPLSKNDLMLVGIALYWGEGYKKTNWSIIFSNSDPLMNSLMMKLFRDVCCVPLQKIHAQIQIYPNMLPKTSMIYWAEVTDIPISQFMKPNIQISSRSKLKRDNTLPHGTLRIRINDVLLVNKIKGWIDGLARQYANK